MLEPKKGITMKKNDIFKKQDEKKAFKKVLLLTLFVTVVGMVGILNAERNSAKRISAMQQEINQRQRNYEMELEQQRIEYEERLNEMESVKELVEKTKNDFKNERFALEEAVRKAIIFEIVQIKGDCEPVREKESNNYEYVAEKDNLFASENEEAAYLMEALVWAEDEAQVTFKKVSDIEIKEILIEGNEVKPNKDGTYTISIKKRDAIKLEIIAEKTYLMWITEGTHYWM